MILNVNHSAEHQNIVLNDMTKIHIPQQDQQGLASYHLRLR